MCLKQSLATKSWPVLEDGDPGLVLVVNVTVSPLVVLPLLDDHAGLVVDHPCEAAVNVLSQSGKVNWYKDRHSETTKFWSRCDSHPLAVWRSGS